MASAQYTETSSNKIDEYVRKQRPGHRFEELSERIIGAAIAVHKQLGPGFLENIYEEALKVELTGLSIFFENQKGISIDYNGVRVGTHRLDLLIEKEVVVELKAVKELADIHHAQLRSYLRASGCCVGLLLNFAKPRLEIKRIVN